MPSNEFYEKLKAASATDRRGLTVRRKARQGNDQTPVDNDAMAAELADERDEYEAMALSEVAEVADLTEFVMYDET